MKLAKSADFGGKSDWRLPTENEFRAVVDYSCIRAGNPLPVHFGMRWTGGRGALPTAWTFTFYKTGASVLAINSDGAAEVSEFTDFARIILVRSDSDTQYAAFQRTYNARITRVEEEQAKIEKEKLEQERLGEARRQQDERDSLAREGHRARIEPLIASLKCEEARRRIEAIAESERPTYSHEECLGERAFRSIGNSSDPNQIFLAAAKYEANDERGRAKSLYLLIVDKFKKSPVAMRAADRITALADVEAIERSNASKEQAVRQASEEMTRQSTETRKALESANSAAGSRARSICRSEVEACYSRGGKSCYRDCDSLR